MLVVTHSVVWWLVTVVGPLALATGFVAASQRGRGTLLVAVAGAATPLAGYALFAPRVWFFRAGPLAAAGVSSWSLVAAAVVAGLGVWLLSQAPVALRVGVSAAAAALVSQVNTVLV